MYPTNGHSFVSLGVLVPFPRICTDPSSNVVTQTLRSALGLGWGREAMDCTIEASPGSETVAIRKVSPKT
jgi:hypothetical protein